MAIRKSLEGIRHMVKEVPYNSELPNELKPFHCYITDAGHSIMCIIKNHLERALNEGFDNFELPVPVKYVLETGYEIKHDRVIVEATYDWEIYGLMVGDEYFEF